MDLPRGRVAGGEEEEESEDSETYRHQIHVVTQARKLDRTIVTIFLLAQRRSASLQTEIF